MLRWLSLNNFRSFREARVEFSVTGLTAVIGANGSGKSNLIKALDFIGSVARDGLDATVGSHGLVEGIVPKSLPTPTARSAEIKLEYEFDLPPFEGYPSDGPRLLCGHRLHLTAHGTRQLTVEQERLTFAEPLYVQHMLAAVTKNGRDAKVARSAPAYVASELSITRDRRNRVTVEMTPAVSSDNVDLYLRWFGMGVLAEKFKQDENYDDVPKTLAQLFEQATHERAVAHRRRVVSSLLDPGGSSLISFSSEALAFQSYLATMRTYDMQLQVLRQQQSITSEEDIAHDGKGMPAAVRHLKNNVLHKEAWARLSATLRDIAPYITDTSVSQLRSGEEFVQFVEQRTGRPVESWHASDGTLRALAILVALETHGGGVLLIEQPEQGLHPWAVRSLVAHMREVIRERSLAVVMTTHSQHVLECLEPREVVLSVRTPTEGSRLRALTDVCDAGNIEAGDVGRLWVSGLLGAVPSYDVESA